MTEDRSRYMCPACGTGGGGPSGSVYECHECGHKPMTEIERLNPYQSELDVLREVIKGKNRTIDGLTEQAKFYKERDEKLHERIDALEAELFRSNESTLKKAAAHSDMAVMYSREKERADKVEAELAALKKDARELAELVDGHMTDEGDDDFLQELVDRILEATKDMA